MNHGVHIVYDFSMALMSTSLLLLLIVLIFICSKKPLKPKPPPQLPKFSAQPYPFCDVHVATDGFHPSRIIGRGKLGIVYIATSTNGDKFAAKRISSRLVLSNAGFGFSSIVRSLSLSRHPNIVPIFGFSEAPGERIVIMEFMGMKSLEFYLHGDSLGAVLLDWERRLRIAVGAARGVEYLHESMAPSIIHGCIKPSNILIDTKFSAKICDYGLSFLAPQERRDVCKENDVYGLGIVLLELISGRIIVEEGLLVEWALPLIRTKRIVEVLDPRLLVPSDIEPLLRLAKVASACVGNSRENRPTIVQVTAILNDLDMKL